MATKIVKQTYRVWHAIQTNNPSRTSFLHDTYKEPVKTRRVIGIKSGKKIRYHDMDCILIGFYYIDEIEALVSLKEKGEKINITGSTLTNKSPVYYPEAKIKRLVEIEQRLSEINKKVKRNPQKWGYAKHLHETLINNMKTCEVRLMLSFKEDESVKGLLPVKNIRKYKNCIQATEVDITPYRMSMF